MDNDRRAWHACASSNEPASWQRHVSVLLKLRSEALAARRVRRLVRADVDRATHGANAPELPRNQRGRAGLGVTNAR